MNSSAKKRSAKKLRKLTTKEVLEGHIPQISEDIEGLWEVSLWEIIDHLFGGLVTFFPDGGWTITMKPKPAATRQRKTKK